MILSIKDFFLFDIGDLHKGDNGGVEFRDIGESGDDIELFDTVLFLGRGIGAGGVWGELIDTKLSVSDVINVYGEIISVLFIIFIFILIFIFINKYQIYNINKWLNL